MELNTAFLNDKYLIESTDNFIPSPQDIDDFTAIITEEEVYKFVIEDEIKKSKEERIRSFAENLLKTSKIRWQDEEELRFLIRKSSDNKIVGIIGIDLDNSFQGEIWFYKTKTERHFMFEALVEVLSYLNSRGFLVITAVVDLENFRSQYLLSRLGFKQISSNKTDILFRINFNSIETNTTALQNL